MFCLDAGCGEWGKRVDSFDAPKSVFENSGAGSTGHWPVPSGDSPDGTGKTPPTNQDRLFM